MVDADVESAMLVAAAAFEFDIDAAERELPGAWQRWRDRIARLLETDADGCFVAVRDEGAVIGVAQAMIRDQLWILSLLTVDPRCQSAGAGRALMDAALTYRDASIGPGVTATPGLIVASNDPRALRLYARAGFELRPTFAAEGKVDAATLPELETELKRLEPRQFSELESLTRVVRGATYTQELKYIHATGARVLGDGERGFVVTTEGHGIWALVAADEHAARTLLYAGLRDRAGARVHVRWLTAAQQWAIDIALAAGLELKADGALCVRGEPGTLYPFVPSGPFA